MFRWRLFFVNHVDVSFEKKGAEQCVAVCLLPLLFSHLAVLKLWESFRRIVSCGLLFGDFPDIAGGISVEFREKKLVKIFIFRRNPLPAF